MDATMNKPHYTDSQAVGLVALRLLIGWHFLYEGLAKLLNPNWTAAGYLMDAKWLFAGVFREMATSPTLLEIINFLNIWGLLLIGLGLIVGLLTRVAGIAGILLLGLYYFAHPPFVGLEYGLPAEGSYWIVNKNLIEMAALLVLVLFPTSHIVGLERLLDAWKAGKMPSAHAS